MNNDSLEITHLILEASIIVQAVMLILLIASIISWWFIFAKSYQLKKAKKSAQAFENTFWSGGNLKEMYEKMQFKRGHSDGLEAIFDAGYREYTRQSQLGADAKEIVQASQRAMRVGVTREIDKLEERLSFLATVGSTSPYIGLFGTVIGIMNSFRGLGNAQQATLNMVAPGIAEALVATAIGLLAAIPAVIAYNRFSDGVERLDNRYENFKDEFASLIHRQAKSNSNA